MKLLIHSWEERLTCFDSKLYKGHLSFDFDKGGKNMRQAVYFKRPKWHHVISVLQAAASQKCYHMTRILQPRTKTNGPWSEPKKSTCPRTSEMDSIKVHKVGTRKLISYTTLRKLSLNCHFIQTDFAMDKKLWDIWAYFRLTEMYTAKRSNENEFRSQHYLTQRERRLINIHLKTH